MFSKWFFVTQKETTPFSFCRLNAHGNHLKKYRPGNTLNGSSCCNFQTNLHWAPFSRKDVLVKNPRKIHVFRKIVGERFLNILRALNRKNTKDSQAIKRKIHGSKLSKQLLSDSDDNDKDEKVSIYNIEGNSEVSRNKTIIELRRAILKLLENVWRRSQSSKKSKKKTRGRDNHRKRKPQGKSDDNKSTKTEIEENADTDGTNPVLLDNHFSAKQANTLDLLNFIARMKGMELDGPENPYSLTRMQRMHALEKNGPLSMLNARDMMSQRMINTVSGMQPLRNRQSEGDLNGLFRSGSDGVQMQEMNLAEQRKLIEDQMQNHVAELQLKERLKDLEQEIPPLKDTQNYFLPRLGSNVGTRILPVQQFIPFDLRRQQDSFQPAFSRLNSFIPFVRPLSRLRPGIPFLPRFHRRFRFPMPYTRFHRRFYYPATRFDDEDDDDDGDDEDYDDDERYHLQASTPPPEDDDYSDYNTDDEHNDSDSYDR